MPLKEPTRDLFMWSVLLNRIEMGKFFWEEGKVTGDFDVYLFMSIIYKLKSQSRS